MSRDATAKAHEVITSARAPQADAVAAVLLDHGIPFDRREWGDGRNRRVTLSVHGADIIAVRQAFGTVPVEVSP